MTRVSIFDEPKIDCHVHVLDPKRFPYQANTHYAPAGQELGTPQQLAQLMEAYGTRHALLVGPNSGYGLDNSCMLDTLAHGNGRYKGIAVVANDATADELRALKDRGVVGVAWNVTHYGVDYYRNDGMGSSVAVSAGCATGTTGVGSLKVDFIIGCD